MCIRDRYSHGPSYAVGLVIILIHWRKKIFRPPTGVGMAPRPPRWIRHCPLLAICSEMNLFPVWTAEAVTIIVPKHISLNDFSERKPWVCSVHHTLSDLASQRSIVRKMSRHFATFYICTVIYTLIDGVKNFQLGATAKAIWGLKFFLLFQSLIWISP